MMSSKHIILFVACILSLSTACRKDEPKQVFHSGTTRIEYKISNPEESPHLEFVLDSACNLIQRTHCSVKLIANESSELLTLTIMLEDEDGNRSDVEPFVIGEEEILKDDQPHTYTYDFNNKLGSTTNSTMGVDIQRIKKILVFINAGTNIQASEGVFWLDRIELGS